MEFIDNLLLASKGKKSFKYLLFLFLLHFLLWFMNLLALIRYTSLGSAILQFIMILYNELTEVLGKFMHQINKKGKANHYEERILFLR